MLTKVQKWGNSLAVRIPKPLAEEMGISDNSKVNMALHDGKLTVSPISIPKYSLKELVAGITKKNVHPEYDWGRPQGKEVW